MEKSRMEKSWRRSREQRQNNRGSSIVLVVGALAVVGTFAVILLSLSLMNYRMKHVNLQAQDNFYDAEKVLDEIRAGLAVDVADAAGAAYQETLEKYSKLSVDERKEHYAQTFSTRMLSSSLISPTNAGQWNPDYLRSLVSAETKAGTKDGNGLTIESVDGLYFLNQDTTTGNFTIKRLKITYVDKNDYMTEIRTDINIDCPEIDYAQTTKVPELTTYCIVAQNKTSATGLTATGVEIKGNAYLGNQGTDFNNSSIKFKPNGESGYLTTGGEFKAYNGANITADSGLEVWGRDLYLDSASWASIETGTGNCKLYLNDDLTLANHYGTSVSATLKGEVYAYGNPDNVRGSGVYVDNKEVLNAPSGSAITFQTDVANNPENYSSAFLINGKNATLDLRGITQMQIAGNAYVAAKKQAADQNEFDVMMGESVALKADQRAYLVPAENMAPDCESGGMNPMNSKDYLGDEGQKGLCQEVAEYHGITKDAVLSDPTWLIKDKDGKIFSDLEKRGVVGVRQAYFPTNIGGTDITMVYFFMVFKNAAYARDYATKEGSIEDGDAGYFVARADEVRVRIDDAHYNTDVFYPSGVAASDPLICYFNGSILYADSANRNGGFLTGRCTSAGKTPTQLAREQNRNQEKYAALCHMLKVDYTELAANEKGQSVYDNLVKKDYLRTNASGAERIFTRETSGEKTIVTNENYEINDMTDTDVHVVIAGGTVRVSRSFTGLILAGGDIIFTNPNITIQSDSSLVKKALAGKNASYGDLRPVDFLYGGEQYLNPEDRNINSSDVDNSSVNYLDSITYSNWKKQ